MSDFEKKKEGELKLLMKEKEEIEFALYKVKANITSTKKQIKQGEHSDSDKAEIFEAKWRKSMAWESFYRLKCKHLSYRLMAELRSRGMKVKDASLIVGCSEAKGRNLSQSLDYAASYLVPTHRLFINFAEKYHKVAAKIKSGEQA